MTNFTSIFTGNQIESRLASYGECKSSIDSSVKSVTLTQVNNRDANFELFTGITVRVKFNNANVIVAPLLNVNNTGAKPIILYGNTPAGDTIATSWQEGSIVSFTYDGGNWVMNNYREAGNIEVAPEEETIEYTYEYDGDTENAERGWLYNYGGTKIFARLGDIPNGTINLIDATLVRTNPSNQWLDKTFTITEEHLTKSLIKSETEIPATQDGLIQIYDIMASDFSEFTVLAICTKPGWYNVCFDDWYEIINFPETGIYAYDKRPYGGNDYLSSFKFTTTIIHNNNQSGSGTVSGGGTISNTVTPITYQGNDIQVFHRGICIGDSVTEGSFDDENNGAIIKKYGYPEYLGRLMNAEVVNAGIAGATSKTWYEASLDSNSLYGKWVNQSWVWNMDPPTNGSDDIKSALDYSGFDFAVIHIGINDIGLMGETTIEDTLTTFEWYTNQIITKLKEANSGIKIFLATIIPSYAPSGNTYYEQLNQRIETIVGYSTDVYLLNLNYYSECATDVAFNVVHPTALGYQKIASEIYSMISYIIHKNRNEFKQVQFCNRDAADMPDGLTKSNYYTNAKIEELIGGASENCRTLGQIEWALSDLYTNKANTTSVYTKTESDNNYYYKSDVYNKTESDTNYYYKADVYTKTEVDTIIDSLRSVVLAQGSANSLTVSEDIANFSLVAVEGSFARSTTTTVHFAHLLNITELLNGAAVSVSVLDGGQAYNFTCNITLSNNVISGAEATYVYGNGKTGDATITIQRIIGIR